MLSNTLKIFVCYCVAIAATNDFNAIFASEIKVKEMDGHPGGVTFHKS